jgi:hypothetical protein
MKAVPRSYAKVSLAAGSFIDQNMVGKEEEIRGWG